MLIKLTSIIASVGLLANVVSASGKIAQVVDASNFCVFLPPSDSVDRLISDTEWDGDAFCLGSTPEATGAETMPTDFIQSAHFVATDEYVQVTGQIDPSKANLNVSDEGGQFDVRAPIGSTCAGWTYYVNLIEPINLTYCMRCCNDTTNCNRGISEKGCAHIIPGDYSGPMDTSAIGTTPDTTTPTTSDGTTAPTSDPVTPTTTSPIEESSSSAVEATPAASSTVAPGETTPSAESTPVATTSVPVPSPAVSSSDPISKPSQIPNSQSSGKASSASEPLSQETDSAQSINSAASMLQPRTFALGGAVLLVAVMIAA